MPAARHDALRRRARTRSAGRAGARRRPGARRRKAGEVLIEVSYAGVNRPDCLQRAGAYPPPPDASPIIGLEVAGTIVACGEGVDGVAGRRPRLRADARAAATPNTARRRPSTACRFPSASRELEAASLPENYFTVWNNVFDRGHLAAGETFLVHGGIERHRPHGDPARQALRRDGDHHGRQRRQGRRSAATSAPTTSINYREQDFVAEVARITGKRGVDVVLDMVGGDYIAKNLKCLALDGRLVIIGFLQGSRAEIDWRHVMVQAADGDRLDAAREPPRAQGGDRAIAAREGVAAVRARAS